jgi:hypothetical protein
MVNPDHIDPGQVAAHALAGLTVVSIWTWLPPLMATIASVMAIAFYAISIYKATKK